MTETFTLGDLATVPAALRVGQRYARLVEAAVLAAAFMFEDDFVDRMIFIRQHQHMAIRVDIEVRDGQRWVELSWGGRSLVRFDADALDIAAIPDLTYAQVAPNFVPDWLLEPGENSDRSLSDE